LHVTLAFIGDVDAKSVVRLREIGRNAARGSSSVRLVLDRIGAFHKQEIAWLGCSRGERGMQRLADGLFRN
jgi:2'-5' RNA ligase